MADHRRKQAEQEIAAVNDALRAGHPPHGFGNKPGAAAVAAKTLKVGRWAFRERVGAPGKPGTWHKEFKLSPDWSLYRAPAIDQQSIEEPADPRDRQLQGARDRIRDLETTIKQLRRDAHEADVIRETVGIVRDTPTEPPKWLHVAERRKGEASPEVPVTIWSDWHVGEVVEKAAVNGINEFNFKIAEERVHRLVDTTIKLCRQHHNSTYPGIVVNLIGDLVSGGLHEELRKTDEDDAIPCVLAARSWAKEGLRRFADEFGAVYVPCAMGNHGRLTTRPEFKRYYRKNWDYLICRLLQQDFADDPRVRFDIRPSNDVHYRVYGESYLACHGDMLGVKGGDGIIGSIGPITRGEVKQAGQSSALGLGFTKLIIGHWHQRLWLPRAIVNNALKGFDEFAMKALGAKPDRPTQALWFVHPSHGITAHWDVYVDDKPAPARDWVSWQRGAAA